MHDMRPEVIEAIKRFEEEHGRPITRDEINILGSKEPYEGYVSFPASGCPRGAK